MPAPNRKPAAAADPVEGDRALAAVARETRAATDAPTVTGGTVTGKDRESRKARLKATHQQQQGRVTDRNRREFSTVVEAAAERRAAVEAVPDAPTLESLPPAAVVIEARPGRSGTIPAAAVERIARDRVEAFRVVTAAAVASGDPRRIEAALSAADFDRGVRVPPGRWFVTSASELRTARAAVEAATDAVGAAYWTPAAPRPRKVEAARRPGAAVAAAAVEDRHRGKVEAAYAAAVETVGITWGDPLPSPVEAGSLDRAAWKAAGGVVEVLPPARRPKRRSAPLERRTRQTGGAIDPAMFGPGESGPRGERVTRSKVADLSPLGRATVESVALAAAAALIDPAAPRATAPAVSLSDAAAAALGSGDAVRVWLTGVSYADAGKVEGTDNPKRPRAAWFAPASGSGRVRVMFAPGGEITTAGALVTPGSAGRLALAIRKAGAISPDTAVSVSLTGKAAQTTPADWAGWQH